VAIDQMRAVIQNLRSAVLPRDEVELTDGQLLERFVNRLDEAAFTVLVRRHGPMVWGVCRRLLGHHDAEDSFQATFLVLARKAASIIPKEMVPNWLYGVAYQTALKARATAAKRRTRERQIMEMPEIKAMPQEKRNDLQSFLDVELHRLPDKYRVAIVLCDLEGKSRKESARELRIPEGTLSSRLSTARRMLAKRLARYDLPISGGTLVAALSQSTASARVPPSIMFSTIKAATLVAAGCATSGVISAKVTALTEGVLKSMVVTKFRTLLVMLGVLASISFGLGLSAYRGFAQQSENENKKEPIRSVAEVPVTRPADKPDANKSEAQYCWLVFGPKGKLRILFRFAGDEVWIDRDGDGKFDSKGERFKSEKDCKDVVIADPDGKTSYVITYVHGLHVVPPEKFVEVRVHIRGDLAYPQSCLIQLGDKAKGSPEAHFNGPLTIAPTGWRIVNRAGRLLENELLDLEWLVPQSVKRLAGKTLSIESNLPKSLKRIGEPTNLWACVVTEGEHSVVSVCSPDDTDEGRRVKSPFSKGVHPFVDVEFPARKQGGPPVKQRYSLDQHVGDGCFQGAVRVPAEAGVGRAKLTFSVDTWKGAKVAPTTVEIPISELQEEKKN